MNAARLLTLLLSLLLSLLAGASLAGRAQSARPASFAPANWDANVRQAEAADVNPDPAIVEVHLTARVASVEVAPGKRVNA